MNPPIPTDLGTLLLGVKDRLVSQGVFRDTQVYFSLDPDFLVFPTSDQFCTITPGPQTVSRPAFVGGGRDVMLMNGQFKLSVWSRLSLDQMRAEDSWLTDSTYGVLTTTNLAINALVLWIPVDKDNNLLMHKGYELASIEHYARKKDNTVGWGIVEMDWKLDWQMSLNPQTEYPV